MEQTSGSEDFGSSMLRSDPNFDDESSCADMIGFVDSLAIGGRLADINHGGAVDETDTGLFLDAYANGN